MMVDLAMSTTATHAPRKCLLPRGIESRPMVSDRAGSTRPLHTQQPDSIDEQQHQTDGTYSDGIAVALRFANSECRVSLASTLRWLMQSGIGSLSFSKACISLSPT